MYMKKVYILITILSVFMLVSTVAVGQLKPNDYYRIYPINGEWFWSWQIDYKTNEMINNSKYRGIKDKIIDKIGFDNFYNITFSTMVDTFQKTGIIWNDFTLGFRWIPIVIHNWIEIKVIITALLGER